MGFIRWAFSRNTPEWVKSVAYALAMSLALIAWVLFLKFANVWAVVGAIFIAFTAWLIRAYREYRRARTAGGQ